MRQFGGDDGEIVARALAVDAGNNVYAAGEFFDTIDFNVGGSKHEMKTDKDGDAPGDRAHGQAAAVHHGVGRGRLRTGTS